MCAELHDEVSTSLQGISSCSCSAGRLCQLLTSSAFLPRVNLLFRPVTVASDAAQALSLLRDLPEEFNLILMVGANLQRVSCCDSCFTLDAEENGVSSCMLPDSLVVTSCAHCALHDALHCVSTVPSVSACRKTKPCVFSDVFPQDRNLPDMDGLALIQAIRADMRFTAIPVIGQSLWASLRLTLLDL